MSSDKIPPITGRAWKPPLCVSATVSYRSVNGTRDGEVLAKANSVSTIAWRSAASLTPAAVHSSQSALVYVCRLSSGKPYCAFCAVYQAVSSLSVAAGMSPRAKSRG